MTYLYKDLYKEWLPVISGIPQGYVLGPLLFLMYINDHPDVIKNTNGSLFADDTELYIQKFLMLLRVTKFRMI